mmetsp:Transcript_1166/g.3250  ORF Transcript_1166/g.3250 Transcript_1166/m.3250 type:complete len:249 (+) Transcript_1166:313-1059(+)
MLQYVCQRLAVACTKCTREGHPNMLSPPWHRSPSPSIDPARHLRADPGCHIYSGRCQLHCPPRCIGTGTGGHARGGLNLVHHSDHNRANDERLPQWRKGKRRDARRAWWRLRGLTRGFRLRRHPPCRPALPPSASCCRLLGGMLHEYGICALLRPAMRKRTFLRRERTAVVYPGLAQGGFCEVRCWPQLLLTVREGAAGALGAAAGVVAALLRLVELLVEGYATRLSLLWLHGRSVVFMWGSHRPHRT